MPGLACNKGNDILKHAFAMLLQWLLQTGSGGLLELERSKILFDFRIELEQVMYIAKLKFSICITLRIGFCALGEFDEVLA